MKTSLVRANSLESFGLAPLSTREQVDAVRYEDSLADFIKAAWRHANEPQTFQCNWHIDCDQRAWSPDLYNAAAAHEIPRRERFLPGLDLGAGS
jgi:hypothetical protein